MKTRQINNVSTVEKLIEKALVIAVQMAIESVPIVGPIYVALSAAADYKQIRARQTQPKLS